MRMSITFDTDCWSPKRSTHWWSTWAGSEIDCLWSIAYIDSILYPINQSFDYSAIILPRSIIILFCLLLVSAYIIRFRLSTSSTYITDSYIYLLIHLLESLAFNAMLGENRHDVKANNNQHTRGKMAKTDNNKTNISSGIVAMGVLYHATFGNAQDLSLPSQNIQHP